MKTCFVTILVLICVIVPWQIWRQGRDGAQKGRESLQNHAPELDALANENKQLSNSVARLPTNALSQEEFRELLRLRGQMTSLHNGSNEIETLKSRIAQLQVVLSKPAETPPDPQKILAHWPKAQLAPAGYGDPLAALQTALSAVNQNDPKDLLDSVTPASKAELAREQWYDHASPEVEMAKSTQRFADSLAPVDGFDIVGQDSTAPDKATVDVYFEGEARTRQMLLEQTNGAWKLAGFGGGWGIYFP